MNFIQTIIKWLRSKNLTFSRGKQENPQSREEARHPKREVSRPSTDSLSCPNCLSTNFQKRGFRQKKLERVQLYLCSDCNKTFTAHKTRGKHYPLVVMLDAISIYNLGYSLEQTCKI